MEVYIGKVVRTKGLKGEVIVHFFSPRLVCNKNELLLFENPELNKRLGPYQVEEIVYYKFYKSKEVFILKLKGINSITEAEVLQGCYIVQDRVSLPENLFLNRDIMYSKVILKENNFVIGKVIDIIKVKNDYKLLLVKTKQKEEIFVPFIKSVIDRVDVENKKIYVNKIDGITV